MVKVSRKEKKRFNSIWVVVRGHCFTLFSYEMCQLCHALSAFLWMAAANFLRRPVLKFCAWFNLHGSRFCSLAICSIVPKKKNSKVLNAIDTFNGRFCFLVKLHYLIIISETSVNLKMNGFTLLFWLRLEVHN